MLSKRKIASASANFNFRPQSEARKLDMKGTRPLPNPVTIRETFLTMILQVCRKLLFFNSKLRVGLYLAGLFFSFVFDVVPFPKSYFSRTDNVLNQYFVKWGWAWTLVLTLPFVFLTSFTYCCGNRKLVLMHLSRLGIATIIWFTFTTAFSVIDNNFGRCSKSKDNLKTKKSCTAFGHSWNTLDISGHTFILIWSTLVIIEEARVINGWESVKDMIRNEAHSRDNNLVDLTSPLKKLSDAEFQIMVSSYHKFSPYIKTLFLSMTCLTVIWDIMIIATIVYFHTMIEKIIAGLFAISMWFATYKYWYANINLSPQQPGHGLFKYKKETSKQKENSVKSRSSNSSSLLNKKSGSMPGFVINNQVLKGQDVVKDDFVGSHESDLHKITNDKKQDDALSQSLVSCAGKGVTTRSQALKNLKYDGNKVL